MLKDDKLEERGKEEIGKKDGETEKEPDGKRDTEVDTREEEEQLKGEENDEGGKAMMKYDNVEEETGDEEREKETMENPKGIFH